MMLGNKQSKDEGLIKALRTKATYCYLDNRMIHLQAAVTISEQDIIPVSAVSQTYGYLIWEQGVPNLTNNNTVLPSRTLRAQDQDQRHYAASECWIPRNPTTDRRTLLHPPLREFASYSLLLPVSFSSHSQ